MAEVHEQLESEMLLRNGMKAAADSGQMKKVVVFILVGHYLPGFKGGGPTRSISNLVSALGHEFEFKVITSDRDLGATTPYPGVSPDRWIRMGNADVMYLRPGWRSLFKITVLLRSMDQNSVLYLNSLFSRRFSMLGIFLRRIGLIRPGCVVIAPRGEFSPGALKLKRGRKMLHIRLSRLFGLYRGVVWHASSQMEADNIRQWFDGAGVIRIAPVIPKLQENENLGNSTNLSSRNSSQPPGPERKTGNYKAPGHLRLVFLSRISPMKNLSGALSFLQTISGEVSFDIYGPLEDSEYWNTCKMMIETLPPNVRVHYAGEVEHGRVIDVFAQYDLFLLPTLGENYGHVICEALSAGCPVLISDRTPWRELQNAGVGWAVPVDQTHRFSAILQQCVNADEEWYAQLRVKAREYARERIADPGILEANRKLFEKAMGTIR
jgi:glycosyltransferase involved in cell wall biosynthesis